MRVIGARVLVEEIKLEEKVGGVIIPGRSKESTNKGKVVAIGDGAVADNGTKIPMRVKIGETVIYTNFAGTPIVTKDKSYIILNERDILLVLDENDT